MKGVSELNADQKGAGGTDWADRLYPPPPSILAPQSIACLTACLASPGSSGGVRYAQTQEGWNQGNIVLLKEESSIFIRHS